ncbi:alanine racemase [Nocardioides humilatus]|uniref:Alanine racemase n=1 Tax=Nocardioides humilatus TaxID=2607660 RepID=A0A5B1LKW9_9ACTN|nr:alanine racemase [Nocardioides humilatus]KAA1421096.1 alanine racemase [Nocardioides humilatus]
MTALATAVPAAATLEVDLEAVAANTRLFAERSGRALMAVVKADGFGHGATQVARTALRNGASWLGVTSLDEAVALRLDDIDAPVLSWLNPAELDFSAAITYRVDVAVPGLEHLAAVVAASDRAGRPARVHLQLDVGMAREGASPRDWARLCRAADRAERAGRIRVVGVMGHLARGDEPGHPANKEGRDRFAWGVAVARRQGLRPPLRHLAATAATLTDPLSRHTLCRVGAGLVGIDPSGTTPLHPAMTLTAPVVSVRDVKAGTPVGYTHTWSATRSTRLALLPLGYADGLPRSASNRAEVWLHGRRCPVVGRISMDQVVVDAGAAPVTVGEVATVFGPGDLGEPTVADWARWSDTIEHEIVTGIGHRVRR